MYEGDLTLSAGDWLVAAAVGVGGTAGLVRVWLPIVLDGFELIGIPIPAPAGSPPKGRGRG